MCGAVVRCGIPPPRLRRGPPPFHKGGKGIGAALEMFAFDSAIGKPEPGAAPSAPVETQEKTPCGENRRTRLAVPRLRRGRGNVVPVSAEKPSGCRVSDLSSPGGFTVTDSRGLSPHSTCRPGGRSLTRYRICPYYTTPGAVCKEAVSNAQRNQFCVCRAR